MKKLMLCMMLWMVAWSACAQQYTITGKVRIKNNGDSIGRVSVAVKGTTAGTIADEHGRFTLSVPALPVTLVFTSVGFLSQEVQVSAMHELGVEMEPVDVPGNSFVIAATRMPIRILESPVSIERYGSAAIRNMPSPSYYDLANYQKGVDMTTSSLTFKTISTRGFNGSGSARVNQLVDGMDNQAPGMNFFVGNFVGLTDLDVDHVEILPGASSALYGPGGINGTVLITSKDPFRYQGLSILMKEGVKDVDHSQRPDASSFHDLSLRWARAWKNQFAVRISAQYIQSVDWLANDSSNYSRSGVSGKVIPGNRTSDANYDGVNVYGDESNADLYPFIHQHIVVSRTGYKESEVIDPQTRNIKLSGDLRYRFSDKLEGQLLGYWATGSTVYTGNNRYALKDIRIGQYKLELKNPHWFLRSYTTQEDAGNAYSATVTSQFINEAWKPSFDPSNINGSWYPQFAGAYAQARAAGVDSVSALAMARNFADKGRPQAGSEEFKRLFNTVSQTPIPKGGLFLEKSQLWMTEGQYDFSRLIPFVEVLAGANIKSYILNSKGTLFIDTLKPIGISEFGAYAQMSKKILKDRVVLSFSGRYDKNEDFQPKFTPRATAVIRIAEKNNLRISYQTAYRFPSTQQKYIRLNVGSYTILGGLDWVKEYMHADKHPLVDAITFEPYQFKELKPENMRSFELGYKGMITERLMVDAYGYLGAYEDFLGRNTLYQPDTKAVYSTVVNSSTRVKTHGFGLSLDYATKTNYSFFANVYSDVLTDVPTGFVAYFNTPKFRLNAGLGNSGLGKKKRIGFNAMLRWQDGFMSDGDLASGYVPAFTTVDMQVSYRINKIKTVIKLGGTNIFNSYYKNGFGNPGIGGLYYLSAGFNL
ncbi:MAG: TonB-dependent receptor domain-containing protein [Flavisolibacter sp.]